MPGGGKRPPRHSTRQRNTAEVHTDNAHSASYVSFQERAIIAKGRSVIEKSLYYTEYIDGNNGGARAGDCV